MSDNFIHQLISDLNTKVNALERRIAELETIVKSKDDRQKPSTPKDYWR